MHIHKLDFLLHDQEIRQNVCTKNEFVLFQLFRLLEKRPDEILCKVIFQIAGVNFALLFKVVQYIYPQLIWKMIINDFLLEKFVYKSMSNLLWPLIRCKMYFWNDLRLVIYVLIYV